MSASIHNAAAVAPVVAGSAQRVVLAAATSRFEIPEAWLRSNITVLFDAADGYWAITKNIALSIDETAVTTLSSSVPSAHAAAECSFLAQKTPASVDLAALPRLAGDEKWYLAFKVASGYIRVEKSSGRSTSA